MNQMHRFKSAWLKNISKVILQFVKPALELNEKKKLLTTHLKQWYNKTNLFEDCWR